MPRKKVEKEPVVKPMSRKEQNDAKMYKKIKEELKYYEKEGKITLITEIDNCFLFAQPFTKTVVYSCNTNVFQPYKSAEKEEVYLGLFMIRFNPDKKPLVSSSGIINKLKDLNCVMFSVESHKTVGLILSKIYTGEVLDEV